MVINRAFLFLPNEIDKIFRFFETVEYVYLGGGEPFIRGDIGGHKSPAEILRERFPYINEGVLNLPPIRLETFLEACYNEESKGGYHVPISAAKEKT